MEDQQAKGQEMTDEAVRKLIDTDPNYQPLLWKSTEDTPESRARLTTNKDVTPSLFMAVCRSSVTCVSCSERTKVSR